MDSLDSIRDFMRKCQEEQIDYRQYEQEYFRLIEEEKAARQRELRRLWKKNNHDKVLEEKRRYRERHLEEIRERNRQPKTCTTCGAVVTRNNYSNHVKRRHKKKAVPKVVIDTYEVLF